MSKAYIIINGGLVQRVYSDKELDIIILDYDIAKGNGTSDEEIDELYSKEAELELEKCNQSVFSVY